MADSQGKRPAHRTAHIVAGIAFVYVIYTLGLLTGTFGWWPETFLGWMVFFLAGPPLYFLADALFERVFQAPPKDP